MHTNNGFGLPVGLLFPVYLVVMPILVILGFLAIATSAIGWLWYKMLSKL